MDDESTTLKLVVKTIINRDEFKDLVREYEDFTKQDFSLLPVESHEKILRQIHTFKGNFSQFEMVSLVDNLNDLENKLYDKRDSIDVSNIDRMELHSWLTKDLKIIEAYAGNDFMTESEFCYIKKEKLYQIEKKIQETLSPNECRVILPLVKSLSYKSLKDLLKTYPDYVMKLSERLGKSIAPIVITGDEIMLDANYYQDAIKSLVHIFRNAVDHGIETEDERLDKGKEQIGNITCELIDLDNKFIIKISDDGRGIDLKALEAKILDSGIYTQEQLNIMDTKQKYSLIFEQGITTKESANYISGRGVGMSAVKNCIEDLNGLIEVESELDKGTTFTITLTKFQDSDDILMDAEGFMKELMETSREIILNQTGLKFEAKPVELKNMISLNKITALLSLKGTFNSIIMISVNDHMANKLVKGFMIENVEEDDIINYEEDVLGEISNTVLGHTFGKFENINNIFHIGIPAVLSNSDAYIKYTQSQILTCNLVYNEFEFSISMLLVENDINTNDLEEEL
jgi:signal transduction histidine kinase/CheY-specific phosphatase CheX